MNTFNVANFVKLLITLYFIAVLQLAIIALSQNIFNNYFFGLLTILFSLILSLIGGYFNEKN